jgi:hypothetical protein
MKEKRREQAAAKVAESLLAGKNDAPKVVSSWGPYTSTVGTAVVTGVPGLTKAAALTK